MSQLTYEDRDTFNPFNQITKVKSSFIHYDHSGYLNNSKLTKYHCNRICIHQDNYDKRKLIAHAYEQGLKRCSICKCYFKTREKQCVCCGIPLRGKLQQKNHPNRKNKPEFKEYEA